ncbi:MAG: glycosyltransferase family 9 protein [Bdellovibrionales bacterium]
MRILVLQLARFGDIFITWPTLRALRRRYPGAEIHLVVRQRFRAAAGDCEAIDKLWCLDTAQILEPLLTDQGDVDVSLVRLTEWTELLSEQDFDLVINLSFSPFSSYLTSLVSHGNAVVRGYTRYSDGFLAIPDDTSAYFYAQVGVGLSNRYHLAEVFAAVADVELSGADWNLPMTWHAQERLVGWQEKQPELAGDYILFHLGASQAEKIYPAFKWHRVILELQRRWPAQIVLIGSASEQNMAEAVLGAGGCGSVLNLVGKTDFSDVGALIAGAQVLIGADSAPMHLAGFTATPCLNLSFAAVNFWETGPRTLGSRILVADSPADLPSDRVVAEILAMLKNQSSQRPVVYRRSHQPVGYEWQVAEDNNQSWRMIQAIYSGGEWPEVHDPIIVKALWQMREAVNVAITQIPNLRNVEKRRLANGLIEQADLAIYALRRVVPELRPLVSWFETERLRLGPMDLESLIARTGDIYGQLLGVLNLYLLPIDQQREAEP